MNEAQLSFFQALCSICQMIFIGFFSKLCRRKSEHFTIIFVCAGLLLCPITVASMTLLPQSARMPYFMILALIGNIPQGATNMCVVQLLLQATPKKNRALIISIYTLFVTLSNSLLPFFGVSVDTAIFTVNVIESAARFGVLIMMILRYRMMKRRGDLFRPLCEE